MSEFTNEMLATAVKYLSQKKANFVTTLTSAEFDVTESHRDYLNQEVEKLTAVVKLLEAEQDARRLAASA